MREMGAVIAAATLLAVVSPVLTVSRSIPQAVRVSRFGADGVSLSTWMALVLVGELWAIYGLLARVPAEVATNIPNVAVCLLVVLQVARRRGSLPASIFSASVLSIAVVAFAMACDVGRAKNVEAIVAITCSLGLYIPQLRKSLVQSDLEGLSAASWAMNTLAALSWMAYGIIIGKIPIYLPSAVAIPVSLVIALRARRYQHCSEVSPA